MPYVLAVIGVMFSLKRRRVRVNGPCLLDNIVIELYLSVVIYVACH